MRTLLVGIPLLAAVAVLDTSLLHSVRFLNGGFEFILVVVMAWNLARRNIDAPFWGLVGGLLLDIFSGGSAGANTFAMTTIALIIALTEGSVYQASLPMALLIALIGTFWYHLLYLFIISLNGRPINWVDALTYVTLPSALCNLLLMLPVYRVTAQIARLLQPKELGLLER